MFLKILGKPESTLKRVRSYLLYLNPPIMDSRHFTGALRPNLSEILILSFTGKECLSGSWAPILRGIGI